MEINMLGFCNLSVGFMVYRLIGDGWWRYRFGMFEFVLEGY